MCKEGSFFSSERRILTRGGTFFHQMRALYILRFYTEESLFRTCMTSTALLWSWDARCFSHLFHRRMPLIFVLMNLLSNLSIPLLFGCNVGSNCRSTHPCGTKLFTNADIWRWRATTRIAFKFCHGLWTSSPQNLSAEKGCNKGSQKLMTNKGIEN